MKSDFKNILIFLFLLLGIACDKREKKIDAELKTSSSISSINNLKLCKIHDHLLFNEQKIYLSPSAIIKSNSNRIFIYDDYNIYETNLELEVSDIILLKEKKYLFKGKIIDIEIAQNSLLVLDSRYTLKRIPNSNSNKIDEITLDVKDMGNKYLGSFFGLTNIENKHILTTNILRPTITTQNNQIELAYLFDFDGDLMINFFL